MLKISKYIIFKQLTKNKTGLLRYYKVNILNLLSTNIKYSIQIRIQTKLFFKSVTSKEKGNLNKNYIK